MKWEIIQRRIDFQITIQAKLITKYLQICKTRKKIEWRQKTC